jgi:hypothetical protein
MVFVAPRKYPYFPKLKRIFEKHDKLERLFLRQNNLSLCPSLCERQLVCVNDDGRWTGIFLPRATVKGSALGAIRDALFN